MRSGSSLGSSLFGGVQTANRNHQQPHHPSGQRSTMEGIADAASESADRARRYVADVGSSVSETAKDYASSIGNYAEDAQRRVVDQSEQLMEQARSTVQSTVSRVLQEQPLSMVLLGLATGAAVASVLPRTAVERETLGAVGERVAEVAGNVRENLGEAVSQAGEKLKQVADERGLSAEGLKEAAGEVAEAFGSAFKGEQKETGGQGSGGRPGLRKRPIKLNESREFRPAFWRRPKFDQSAEAVRGNSRARAAESVNHPPRRRVRDSVAHRILSLSRAAARPVQPRSAPERPRLETHYGR